MLFGKQKFDVKQLKLNKFIFDVKQLKMNRFIKSISDLIISTSNAKLEVPSLHPWFLMASKVSLSYRKTPKLKHKSIPIIKKRSTVIYLISCSPIGVVAFLSPGYGGRATDIQIVWQSEFITSKYHYPGDQLLADSGFALEKDVAAEYSSELFITVFTKG